MIKLWYSSEKYSRTSNQSGYNDCNDYIVMSFFRYMYMHNRSEEYKKKGKYMNKLESFKKLKLS